MKELKIRSMIVAPKGHVLMSFDLNQAESWVVAYLANELNMKYSLQYSDIHTDTAHALTNIPKDEITKPVRYTYKRCNHAFSYRMSASRFVQVVNKDSDKPPYLVLSLEQGKELYKKWHDYYNLKDWWNDIEISLGSKRELITPYGRRRVFFAQWGNELFKEATAFIPQSTVADHLNGAVQPESNIIGGLLEVYKQYGKAINIVNQSHDSIMAEVPIGIQDEISSAVIGLIKRPLVINDEQFTIPVTCEIGERWGELEEIKA